MELGRLEFCGDSLITEILKTLRMTGLPVYQLEQLTLLLYLVGQLVQKKKHQNGYLTRCQRSQHMIFG